MAFRYDYTPNKIIVGSQLYDFLLTCFTAQTPTSIISDNSKNTVNVSFESSLSTFEQEELESCINLFQSQTSDVVQNFAIDDASDSRNFVSYIGYGQEGACKILRVISSGRTYTNFWAQGNENLNKVWSARTQYDYF